MVVAVSFSVVGVGSGQLQLLTSHTTWLVAKCHGTLVSACRLSLRRSRSESGRAHQTERHDRCFFFCHITDENIPYPLLLHRKILPSHILYREGVLLRGVNERVLVASNTAAAHLHGGCGRISSICISPGVLCSLITRLGDSFLVDRYGERGCEHGGAGACDFDSRTSEVAALG